MMADAYKDETTPWRDEETLRRLYHREGLTVKEVANHFGCGATTVRDWMERHNIDRRDVHTPAHPDLTDAETLRRMHYEDRMSTWEMADEFGCDPSTVRKWMDRFGIERESKPLEARFWEKVDKGDPDECWEWTAPPGSKGYGRIGIDGKHRRAHRVAYRLEVEEPGDDWVLHHCDNRPCVNPDHLYLGDASDNIQDAYERGQLEPPTGRAGENNPNAKLTANDVAEIRDRLEEDSLDELAKEYGVAKTTVRDIKARRSWR